MPETRGYSLESIQEGFQGLASSRNHDERSRIRGVGRVRRLFTGPVLLTAEQAEVSSSELAMMSGGLMRVELGSV